MKNKEPEKPKIGRPSKHGSPSRTVSARLPENLIAALIKEFGAVGAGIEEAVKAYVKKSKR